MYCMLAVAPPGFRYEPASESAVECGNGFYSSSWDRSDSYIPCGLNPAASEDAVGWHSEGLVQLPVRDPNNDLPMRWLAVRGNSSTCCKCWTVGVCIMWQFQRFVWLFGAHDANVAGLPVQWMAVYALHSWPL
jgi:hypothetical protein